jgi:hypothetical protein
LRDQTGAIVGAAEIFEEHHFVPASDRRQDELGKAPLAANMPKTADDEHAYYHVLRVLMLAFVKGISPIMAMEIARRAIPGNVRPSFQEVEQTCPSSGPSAAAAAAPAEPSRPGISPSSLSRRRGHGRHHGGAWKVAYADFVTAMMALFIVLHTDAKPFVGGTTYGN